MGPHHFEESEVACFVGDELGQIWLDPYGLRVLFESGFSIYIEHACCLGLPDGSSVMYHLRGEDGVAALRDLRLHELLLRKVAQAVPEGPSFRLVFDGGYSLAVMSLDLPYESGHIHSRDGLLVF